ncbi:MAG: hypothetical protein HY392_04005 [Candidatus Diapherotrites archaeon]|nr:hypothetical protein [Candidatus Diapherotrites archaeon]
MKNLLAAVAIAFFLMPLFVHSLEVSTHLVEIEVDEAGFASVVEKYTLDFGTTREVLEFKENATRNSSSLLAWQSDYNFFYPRIGQVVQNIIEKSSVAYEEETRTLFLNYILANRFAQITKEEPRQTIWSVPAKNLLAFEVEGLIFIPENTSVKISIPKNAEIISLEPTAGIRVENNDIFLSGIRTSSFKLEYSVQKPLSSTFNILEALREFASSTPNFILLVIAVVVATVIYAKRKAVTEKIENYVVKHSELEHSRPEEEIDLEA